MDGEPRGFNPQQLLAYARDNDAAAIEHAVLRLGADVTFANRIGQTALHIAAIQGSVEAIQKLVELGLDPNVENAMSQTPLHFAAGAHRNVFETCNALLDLGADPFQVDHHGRLPYEIAKDDELRRLLGGPDPRLFTAAAAGDVGMLRQIFEEEPETDPCPLGGDGLSPLHVASRAGHLGVVNFLLEKGAFPDQRELSTGDTAAHLAVRGGHTALLSLLSRHGVNLNDQNFHKSTYAQGGWTRAGEDLGPLHQAPLHVAVDDCNEEMVRTLLELGASPDVVDFDGRTPLHYTLEFQDSNVATILLHGGANPTLGCRDFFSPLHLASQQGDVATVRVLLQHGASVNAADDQGWTPLMLAVRNGKTGVVTELLKSGANAGATNAAGNTALHLAATNGRLEVCKALLEGAAASVATILPQQNNEGKTAADVAKTDEIRAFFTV